MLKPTIALVAVFWLGVGIGMVAMQLRPKPYPKVPEQEKAIACLTLDDGWVCAFNGKELRYDKNGYIMEPK